MLDLPFLNAMSQGVILVFLLSIQIYKDQVMSHSLVSNILLRSFMNILDVLGFILGKIVLNYWPSLHRF